MTSSGRCPCNPARARLVPPWRPVRLRATYNRYGGVRHMFAALDLSSGQLFYRLRDRKRSQEFLEFLRQLRRRLPTGRLVIV